MQKKGDEEDEEEKYDNAAPAVKPDKKPAGPESPAAPAVKPDKEDDETKKEEEKEDEDDKKEEEKKEEDSTEDEEDEKAQEEGEKDSDKDDTKEDDDKESEKEEEKGDDDKEDQAELMDLDPHVPIGKMTYQQGIFKKRILDIRSWKMSLILQLAAVAHGSKSRTASFCTQTAFATAPAWLPSGTRRKGGRTAAGPSRGARTGGGWDCACAEASWTARGGSSTG